MPSSIYRPNTAPVRQVHSYTMLSILCIVSRTMFSSYLINIHSGFIIKVERNVSSTYNITIVAAQSKQMKNSKTSVKMFLTQLHLFCIRCDCCSWRVSLHFASALRLSHYVTNHTGQLSLAIPRWVGAMSTGDGYDHS